MQILLYILLFHLIGLSEERQQSLSNRGSCCSGSNGGPIVPGTFPLSENNGKYDSEALIGRSSGANIAMSQAVREFYPLRINL